MSRQIQIRRGTSAEHNNFTGAIGEVTMDTTNNTLRVHDGTTAGGHALAQKATTLSGYGINDGAKTDLSNLTNTSKNIPNWSSNVANCIIEIAQDINMTLDSDGTLTLKSGSKVYVPNGLSGTSKIFDTTTTSADITGTRTASQTCFVFLYNNNFFFMPTIDCYSGGTAPSATQYMVWYDSSNNVVKYTTDTGATWTSGLSFPIGITTSSGGALKSIEKVFNGFGYIANHIFVLPGVKGSWPDGRNADGSLKHTIVTVTQVGVGPAYYTGSCRIRFASGAVSTERNFKEVDSLPITAANADMVYHKGQNMNYLYNGTQSKWDTMRGWLLGPSFIAHLESGRVIIDNFDILNTFQLLDYNDVEYMAHQAMPSDEYVNLTLGASGTTYTAIADGYFSFVRNMANAGEYVSMTNNSTGIGTNCAPTGTNTNCRVFLPVSKGDVITISYTTSGATTVFRFVYANGSK